MESITLILTVSVENLKDTRLPTSNIRLRGLIGERAKNLEP